MIRISRVFLAVLIGIVPGIAASWTAVNRHEVFALGNGVFEVVGRPGSGAADYWCGAGDYARHQLGTAGIGF